MEKCKVVSIRRDRGFLWVEVENTSLRVAGGGQPSDRGVMIYGNFSCAIEEVVKTPGGYALRVGDEVDLGEGDTVYCKLDEDYRRLLSRMHTGEHILSRALELTVPGLRILKAELGDRVSTVFVESPIEMDWNVIFRAERLANSVIHEGRKVHVRVVKPEEARRIKDLRIKWDRIDSDFIRLVEVEDFDIIACSGTHVDDTREVGDILVVKLNGSRGKYEVKFELDAIERLWDYSYRMRKVESDVNMQIEDLVDSYNRAKSENKRLQKDFKTIANYVDIPSERVDVNGRGFYFISLAGFPSQVLSMYLSRLHRTCKRDYVVLNVIGDECNLCLSLPSYTEREADNLVACLREKIGAKGGGKGIYRLKSSVVDAEKIVECLRECVR